jgi:putative hydroxymethylpyrimidine transport system ATP-binding protein
MISIDIQNAMLKFEQRVLFQNLSLNITAGQWTCILGASGVGKSSLLRLIAGLAPPNCQATITTSDQQPLKDRVAYMAQHDLLLPWASVLDNVLIGSRLRGQPLNIDHAKTILQDVGLADAIDLKPAQLSGGMRQRVALARTLFEGKPVVLMDEPFSALDVVTRHRLQSLSAELLKDKTVLLVTHDPLEALRLGHRIMILAGAPASMVHTVDLSHSQPPRDIADPHLLTLQSELLQRLMQAMEGVS